FPCVCATASNCARSMTWPLGTGRFADGGARDVLIGLSYSLVPLADHTRALETLQEAERLACSIGDRRRMARVLSGLCGTRWILGSYAGAIESGERALALGSELQDSGIQALTNHCLGQVLSGDYRRGAAAFTRSIEVPEGEPVDHRGVPQHWWRLD